jgi:hypothetical protein
MALLLFVRSIDDVMPAVEAASELLAYKQNLEGNRQSDDLLAIWIDDDLEAALPAWSVSRLGTSSERPTTTPISLRQSFSLSGIWTLCWIDISPSESEHGEKSPREALIGTLAKILSAHCSSTGTGPLFPVFGVSDPIESIETSIANLKTRYPSIIGAKWFIHDRSQGKVVPAERAGGLQH